MTAYELMIKTNHHIIKDGELTDAQKANIVRQLLAARTDERDILNFYKKIKADGGTYPGYYLPPYNDNKKYQTVIPMSPKTHILSMNAYEMEILRLLYLFAPENLIVKDMVRGTFKRLENSCPGGDCCQGECFHSSLPVIRFFSVAALHDKPWIKRLVDKINKGIDRKYKDNATAYYWLCLSELPYDIAEPGLLKYKNEFIARLEKSVSMNTEKAKMYQSVFYYVYRDCLSAFSEYSYIKNRQPYVSEKDGRLCFDMSCAEKYTNNHC
jgi:hypothetical protein